MPDAQPCHSGVNGLDEVIIGGYPSNRAHLIEGKPGSGKTTMDCSFFYKAHAKASPGSTSPCQKPSGNCALLRKRTAGRLTRSPYLNLSRRS